MVLTEPVPERGRPNIMSEWPQIAGVGGTSSSADVITCSVEKVAGQRSQRGNKRVITSESAAGQSGTSERRVDARNGTGLPWGSGRAGTRKVGG